MTRIDARTESRLDELATRGAHDHPAIVVPGGETLTYGELDRAVSRFARALAARGAMPGQRLVLANANTPGFFVALLGAARAGLVAVPLDAGLAAAELRNVLAHARPHAVVVDTRSAPVFEPLGTPLLAVDVTATVEPSTDASVSGTLHARVNGAGDATAGVPVEISAGTARATLHAPVNTAGEAMVDSPLPRSGAAAQDDGDHPALILYTSGTTGTPRGAVHSHAGVLHKVEAIRAHFALGAADPALCMLPTHFGHGLVCTCLTTLHAGATLVLCRPFDAQLLPHVFALAEKHGVTTFSTVPTIVRLLTRNQAVRATHGRLRYITCASAPLHPEEVDAFEARFGVPLLNCYGLTEAGTWSAMSSLDPSRDRRSVGVAVGCTFRAVGPAREPLPTDEVGELEVAGPSIMLGYDGDLGRVDATGRVFLSGRSKDLIIRAGANIYPAEVEGVLLRHPAVAEAYVVGLDHALLGEQVAACVVRKDGAAASDTELIQHCRTALAPYKCPETIRFATAVPKTSRGKVSRAALVALFR